jgi:predicted naringenin-chalcone synthase
LKTSLNFSNKLGVFIIIEAMSYITAIATATPPNRITQTDIAAFMEKTMLLNNGERRKLKTIFRSSGIAYRHSVLPDYSRTQGFEFFPEEGVDVFPTTKERLEIFRKTALPLSIKAAKKIFEGTVAPKDITHLVVVCCTGMYAPGLDIELVGALGLKNTVNRTAINFMGCYAAFSALKIADAFCKVDHDAKVLVICTELCSLHFQRQGTDDNLLANALFADGCAAVLVEGKSVSQLQLELEGFHNDLAPDGNDDMAWSIGDLGFEMKLSAYVPEKIRRGIASLTESLLKKISKKVADIQHFAIHPGGIKILEVIEEELNIHKEKNNAAYHVLRNYGNMSSPTVLFVLDELIRSFTTKDISKNILSFAFGPGLTMESMVLKIKSV